MPFGRAGSVCLSLMRVEFNAEVQRTRQMRKNIRHLGAALAVALLLCAGPARAIQESGRRVVKAGGARLHMEASGRGATTVVLEAGFGGTTAAWEKVQPE